MSKHVILSRRPKAKREMLRHIVPIELPAVVEHVFVDIVSAHTEHTPIQVCASDLPVSVAMVNYKTEHLIRKAYSTFRKFYPGVRVTVFDNGSRDNSTSYVLGLKNNPHTNIIANSKNIGHGPALDIIIRNTTSKYLFALDSDCEVLKGGFLEQMVEKMISDKYLYAIGWMRWVDRASGVPLEWHINERPSDRFVQYAHPACSLYDVEKYKQLEPFIHHGAPAVKNMHDAEKKGYKIGSFPVFEYIRHLKAGTRRMYEGRWNPTESDKPSQWDAGRDYPI